MTRIRWSTVLLLLYAGTACTQRPPATERVPPVAAAALAAPGVNWVHHSTRRADLYFAEKSAAAPLAGPITRDAKQAIDDNLRWLGADDAPKLRLFFVASREAMRPFTGGTPGGWSVTDEGTAFFVANDSVRPALRHETMHLLSWRLWGTPAGQWLSEGLATASVGACRGYTVDEITAALRAAGMVAPLDAIRGQFDASGERGVVHYYWSASLVQYIDRRFGRGRLRRLWSQGGLARAPEILGIDAATLERDWKAEVDRMVPRAGWPEIWGAIKARGCE
jgi:hypothetical protein